MVKLSIRLLTLNDIPHIVRYWHENSDENLVRMGADKNKLGSEEEFTQFLKNLCKAPLEKVNSCYMIWLIDNKLVGYNALKDIQHGDIAHMHLHMWDSEYRGKGYDAQFFSMAALEFYKLFNLKMILCEPRSSYHMPNKMLTKIDFKKWKTYVSTASELSLTSEVNSYIIDPQIARNFLNQATAYIS